MDHNLRSGQPNEPEQEPRGEAGGAGDTQPWVWLSLAAAMGGTLSAWVLLGLVKGDALPFALNEIALVIMCIAVAFAVGGAVGFALRRSQAE